MPWRKDPGYNMIDIPDNRTIDAVTGQRLKDTNRLHAKVDKNYVKTTVAEARKRGIDPYNALAINMQETGFNPEYQDNPYNILFPNMDELGKYQKDPTAYSMNMMAEKNKIARSLGKTGDAESIQAWNGYGKVGGPGSYKKIYGVDTSQQPIDMNIDPVYGKRIVNLRDSVLKTNPSIRNLVEQKANGGYFGNAYSVSGSIGSVPSMSNPLPFTAYKGGGTHEQNPNGGIPVGGKAKVEEGEVRVDFPEGSYIFSARY
jgi:hypothetical protein